MTAPVGGETVVRFAKDLFQLDAIKHAAYRVSDRVTVDIQPDNDGTTCTLRPARADVDPAEIESQFRNEVLDHDLRMRVAKETEPYRNLILSLAFSRTGLQG